VPYSVITHNDEDELAAYLGATVTTYPSEDKLDAGIAAATSVDAVVVKGKGYYTLVDSITTPNVSIRVLAKFAKYTTILETA